MVLVNSILSYNLSNNKFGGAIVQNMNLALLASHSSGFGTILSKCKGLRRKERCYKKNEKICETSFNNTPVHNFLTWLIRCIFSFLFVVKNRITSLLITDKTETIKLNTF